MRLDIQKFSKIVQELIRFKSGTTKVPIRAEGLEELIWATLVFMFGDEKVYWDPQSHEKSVDIFDFYLICAREIKKDTISYYVIKAPSDRLAPIWLTNKNNWIKTKFGYELKEGFGFNARIVFKMSHQLWYSIPVDYFSNEEIVAKVTIPLEELGKGLVEFLKNRFK